MAPQFKLEITAGPNVPNEVVEAVTQLVKAGQYQYWSFPNGSAYWKFVLPYTAFKVGDATAKEVYNCGIQAKDANRSYGVGMEVLYGPGADFGIYYWSKDQIGLKVTIG